MTENELGLSSLLQRLIKMMMMMVIVVVVVVVLVTQMLDVQSTPVLTSKLYLPFSHPHWILSLEACSTSAALHYF